MNVKVHPIINKGDLWGKIKAWNRQSLLKWLGNSWQMQNWCKSKWKIRIPQDTKQAAKWNPAEYFIKIDFAEIIFIMQID